MLSKRRHVGIATSAVAAMVAGSFVAITSAALPASAATNPTPNAGARKNATQLTFGISGTAQLKVDVATGNALLTDRLLTLPGVTSDVPITLSYNSSVFGSPVPAVIDGPGSGWSLTGADQRLVVNSDSSVTYYGPSGLTGMFTSTGSGSYSSPVQFQATLSGSSTSGWTLTDHDSQEQLKFSTAGRLTQDIDKDNNTSTYTYGSGGLPSQLTTTRGPSAGRQLHFAIGYGTLNQLTQSSGTLYRAVKFGYSANGHLVSVTDDVGGVTQFASGAGTDTGQVVTITNPMGKTTTLSFDSSNRVTQVSQDNPVTDGGAGTSVTRLSYPSSTQTLVADPTTDQGQSVSAVPHTTYTLNSTSNLVTKSVDPDGNTRSTSYTSLNEVATATPPASGTSTFSYGGNGGESLIGVAAPGGASGSLAYGNSDKAAYLPSSATDDAGHSLTYTYDGQGNQLTTGRGTSGPQAKVTYNSDGTVSSSASPGAAAGVVTNYTVDSDHDTSQITPPSNSSLGGRSYSYDGFGRLATVTNGRGDTLTYTYDDADRITVIHDSNGNTPDVTYSYDANNRITQRVDGHGTTSYSYDDLGHMTSVGNDYVGTTTSYSYDLNGNLASTTTPMGTTNYGYDAAHLLTSMSYPQGGVTVTTRFANDGDGRRTDTWLQANSDHSTWSVHEHLSYDSSGRITAVLGENGPATSPTPIINQTLCYSAGAVAPNCPSTTSADRVNVVWAKDSVSGETTSYTYDSSNRLTKAVVSGGSNPRTYSYGYDAAGNRTSSSVTGNNPSSQSLTFNDGNQITTSGYSYDGSGDLTSWPGHTATFNAAGQQTSTTQNGVTTYYKYAADDQTELLKQSTSGGNVYTYTYGRPDRNGQPELVSMQNGGSTAYVLDDPSGKPVLLQSNSTTTCLYLYDGNGNPVALANNRSVVNLQLSYDPFGTATRIDNAGQTSASAYNPITFQAGIQDRVTGQVKFGQRWYNSDTGSWMQQDQLNAPLDPNNANRYEYAADNPINQADLTGTSVLGCIGSVFSLVGGALGLAGSIASVVGTGGLDTPAALAVGGGSLGLIGTGLGTIDAC